MKKTLLFFAVLILFAASGYAQAPDVEQPNGTPHQTTLNWTPGTSVTGVTVAGYDVFASATPGGETGTNAINGSTLISGTTYIDTAVTPGAQKCYVVEAKSTAGNLSKPSNEVCGTTPNNPNPPTLSAAIVSIIINGGKETITAQYAEGTAGTATGYELWGSGKLLQRGFPAISNTGKYTVTWTGKVANAANPVLTVEDATGQVATTE